MAENDVRSKEKTILTWKYSTQLITSAACLTGLRVKMFSWVGPWLKCSTKMQHKRLRLHDKKIVNYLQFCGMGCGIK